MSIGFSFGCHCCYTCRTHLLELSLCTLVNHWMKSINCPRIEPPWLTHKKLHSQCPIRVCFLPRGRGTCTIRSTVDLSDDWSTDPAVDRHLYSFLSVRWGSHPYIRHLINNRQTYYVAAIQSLSRYKHLSPSDRCRSVFVQMFWGLLLLSSFAGRTCVRWWLFFRRKNKHCLGDHIYGVFWYDEASYQLGRSSEESIFVVR